MKNNKNNNASLSLIPYSSSLSGIPYSNSLDQSDLSPNNEFSFSAYKLKDKQFNWKSYTSINHYSILGPKELKNELERFFSFYKEEYPKHKYFGILFKIRFRNSSLKSCSTTQVSTLNGFDELYDVFSSIFYLENFADKVSEDDREIYEGGSEFPAGQIIFDFKPMVKVEGTKYERFDILESIKNRKITENKDYSKSLNYKGFKIPNTMDLTLWPNLEFITPSCDGAIMLVKQKDRSLLYTFILGDNYYDVKVQDSNSGVILFTFRDTLIEGYDLSSFKRVITENHINKTYVYKGGKLVLFIEEKNTKFIEKTHRNSYISLDSIMTLDIETRTIGNKMVPICMSIYDGKKSNTFLFENHLNWQADMEKAFKTIMKRGYHYHKIYVHNFSYFDAIFMIDVLSKLGTVKPLIRDNRFIQLKFSFFTRNEKTGKFNQKPTTLVFYDSYLLLPFSLDNLSKSFDIRNKKSVFPFGFANKKDFSFDYIGNVPEYKHFPKAFTDDFTLSDYNEYCEAYKQTKWIFKEELSNYCENDTVALYQIIVKFAKEIFGFSKIDITKFPTAPSVAFAIYRSNFLPKNTIPKILGKLHYTLKESYYGGITDIYRPIGKNIDSQDVNSLYPSSMKHYPMPVGKPKYFSGDPYLIDKDPFGFFKVKVFAPELKIPFLPTKVNTKHGHRTICPIGTWSGWYFSEEIKNAEKYGYKFSILEGYLFEREYIFTDYIDKLYKMKEEAAPTKSSPGDPVKYFIAKLLMNSLYGRFGMNPIAEENCIITAEDSEKIIMERKNVKIIPLISGNAFVTYDKFDQEEVDITDISVIISSAIASYSRIQMSYFMYKYRNNLYAMDTDGIKVDCKLAPYEVDDKELGKMKYEYTFKEAVFVAPKVYGGLLEKPYKKYKTELTKVKGLKNAISYLELKSVLNKNNPLKIMQEKWKRLVGQSSIIVDLESYTISITGSKRTLIFNSWGDLVDTLPIRLNNDEVVSPPSITIYYLSAPKSYLSLPAPKQLLYISAPVSYLALNAPTREEVNIIYILPKIFYMDPPLPSIIYLPGKIQECLPPPPSRLALPSPSTYPALPAPSTFQDPQEVIYLLPNCIKVMMEEFPEFKLLESPKVPNIPKPSSDLIRIHRIALKQTFAGYYRKLPKVIHLPGFKPLKYAINKYIEYLIFKWKEVVIWVQIKVQPWLEEASLIISALIICSLLGRLVPSSNIQPPPPEIIDHIIAIISTTIFIAFILRFVSHPNVDHPYAEKYFKVFSETGKEVDWDTIEILSLTDLVLDNFFSF